MKLAIPECPHCGNPAIGTVDTIPGVAFFNGDPSDGAVDYAGSTEVDWDGQEPRKQDTKPVVTCGDHEWATAIEGLEDERTGPEGHGWISAKGGGTKAPVN